MMCIVCGGRDYTDAARVKLILDAAVTRMGLWCVIEGRCPNGGADRLAQEWAEARPDISLISVRPDDDWPSAGPRRNRLMRDILMGHDGDKGLIAFGGGKGTGNMILQAKEFQDKIKIYEIDR